MSAPVSDEELLAAYREAELTLLAGGQSASAPGRSVTMANLSEIRKAIRVLEARINVRTRGPILMGRPN
jgi:hypothetical protein